MTNAKFRFRIGKVIVKYAQIAQSVEQRTENPRVGGSIPPLGTINKPGRLPERPRVQKTRNNRRNEVTRTKHTCPYENSLLRSSLVLPHYVFVINIRNQRILMCRESTLHGVVAGRSPRKARPADRGPASNRRGINRRP